MQERSNKCKNPKKIKKTKICKKYFQKKCSKMQKSKMAKIKKCKSAKNVKNANRQKM